MSRYAELADLRRQAEASGAATDRARYRAALDALPGALDPTLPCLLLPVRLETRIRPRTDGQPGNELVVRIFPDDIHYDDHDPRLTAAEIELGRHYWRQRWTATLGDAPEAGRSAAWEQLLLRVGAGRAGWLVRVLTPVNLPPVAGTDPTFPDPRPKQPNDGRAPVAALLPDRWIVRAWRDEVLIAEARGELIPRPLMTGPLTLDVAGPAGWMIDLDLAFAAGMAVVLRPTSPEVLDRVDLIIAFGVRGSDTPEETAAQLRDLFDAHLFAARPAGVGFDIVPQGTPTNNTAAQRAPMEGDGIPPDRAPAARRNDGSDADLLAKALGLPDRPPLGVADDDRFVLGRLRNSATADQRDAAAMATLLWPASWGYFLRQFMGRSSEIAPNADLSTWRRFVIDTVRGRGPLPVLHLGDQPYGVLPVLPSKNWRPWPDLPELLIATLQGTRVHASATLRIGADLDATGGYTGGWTGPFPLPADAAADGLDIATADLDGDGWADMVLLTSRGSGLPDATYYVGRRLDGNGAPTDGWSQAHSLPRPADGGRLRGGGVGVALGRIQDVPAIVAVTDEVPGSIIARPPVFALRIGTGIGDDGAVQHWSSFTEVPRENPDLRLAGAALADLANRGAADLVVGFLRPVVNGAEILYRVGRGLQLDGTTEGWSDLLPVPTFAGQPLAAGGIALGTFSNPSRHDLVVHAAAANVTAASYAVGLGLGTDGTVAGGWQGPFNTGSLPVNAGTPLAAGIAVAPVLRDQRVTTGTTTGLVNLADQARASWTAATSGVPRIGRSADPADDLLDLFATDAVSARVATRGLLGIRLLTNMWIAAGVSRHWDVYQTMMWNTSRTLLESWGLIAPQMPLDPSDDPSTPRLTRAAFETLALPLSVPLAGDGTQASLRRIAQTGPDELHIMTFEPDAPLLDRLARHATLQAWADAALALRPPDTRIDQAPWVEPELLDLSDLRSGDPVAPSVTPTAWRHLASATMSLGDPTWPGQPPVKIVIERLLARAEAGDTMARFGTAGRRILELAELRAALGQLSARPADALARALGETLDLASHRLDAWLSALATDRLRALRKVQPDGLNIGGFGILANLHPRTAPPSEGYLQAPSVGQAVTAAILRSGQLSHSGGPEERRLALDLSSARVRLGMGLISGLRAGLKLGAMLGERFEQALHRQPAEAGLERFLPALRQFTSLAAGKLTPVPDGSTASAVAAIDVIDGLALLEAQRTDTIPWGQTVPGADMALPGVNTPEQASLVAILGELREGVDALGDLGLAEAVHQLVHGNPEAAGGALDVLAGGEVPPSDPEVIRTPRAGTGVRHRVLIVLPTPADAADSLAGWATGSMQPRAVAAPRLNAWAATVLGDPGRVRWRARWDGPDGTPIPDTAPSEFTLADLGLCPLDLVAMAGVPVAGATPVADTAATGELERLMRLRAAAGTADGRVPRLDLTAGADWPIEALTVVELLEVARGLNEVMSSARAADVADVVGPSGVRPTVAPSDGGVGAAAEAAKATLQTAREALRAPFDFIDPPAARAVLAATYLGADAALFASLSNLLDLPNHLDISAAISRLGIPAPADADMLRAALRTGVGFAVDGAAPISVAGTSVAELASLGAQARRTAAVMAERLAKAQAAAGPEAKLAGVFATGFLAVPEFAVPEPAVLADALTARTDVSDTVVADWLEGIALVRSGAARLADLRLLIVAVGDIVPPLRVAQLPHRPGDWWAALPASTGATPPDGLLSLVFAGPAFDPARTLAGLVVDEWVEVVPADALDSAVMFHADAPRARAPQALLLACSPDPAKQWDDDTLEHAVRDTFSLAQLRMVDHAIAGAPPVGQFLPAMLLALNIGGDPNGDTISTILQKVKPS
ncbi:MAG TPA: hypothetical protein VGC80_04175 [Acetobacteraceae bacterium]